MINSDPGTDPQNPSAQQQAAVEAIMRSGAKGAVTLTGFATAIVVAIWLAYYLLVFAPRALTP